jgi:hypothetical protein
MKRQPAYELPITIIILAACLTRLVPHWPNATPILGMALAGGALLRNDWRAWAVPLFAMVVSDVALGMMFGWEYVFHSAQVVVYGMVMCTSAIGMAMANRGWVQLSVLGGLASSGLFFLTTNTMVWATGTLYPRTFDGLMLCFAAGAAFFNNELSQNFFLNTLWSTVATSIAVLLAARLMKRWIVQPVDSTLATVKNVR